MSASIRPTQQRTPACDNCRRRKVRCNREQPCGKCQEVFLNCQYTSVPRRKGPKGPTAPVLSSLSSSSNHSSPHTSSVSFAASDAGHADAVGPPSESNLEDQWTFLPTTECPDTRFVGLLKSPTFPTAACQRISPVLLQAHVDIFLKHLYPIMPVFDADTVTVECMSPEALSPRRYAFIVALCAATHLQLKLDISEGGTIEELSLSGQSLIEQAIQALQEFDPLDEPHTDTLLAFFFLFSAYGNLDKHNHAWHYLSQSISFAHLLNLHQEPSYLAQDPETAELRRRIYWLLFITERAYALQRNMPITLRGRIQKPTVFTSNSPALAYGFVNLISVFEKIPSSFYDWNASAAGSLGDSAMINPIYQSVALSTPLLAEYNETQKVDLIVTRQWLQTRLWKVVSDQVDSTCHQGAVVPLDLPITAGKSVMALMSTVAQKSADAHGIGIEQKLYDIGETVSLLAHVLLPRKNDGVGELFAHAQTVLCGIIDLLSNIRGGQSLEMSSLPRPISWPPVGDVRTEDNQPNPLSSVDGYSDNIAPNVGYSSVRDVQGQLISGGITGIVELLDDGTALKAPYPGSEIENNIIDIAKEASIYRRIGPHKRLVRMLGHSREGLVLEYMKNGDLKTYGSRLGIDEPQIEMGVPSRRGCRSLA
ncbi:transcriptional regulator family: Fungal Specific TF [Penicillium roqueforti]|nr:transcriptional regulator family: Fungal Specific TF [Penicillium roqueforti]KAI3156409.1 transcriptional regulator family: Fungal Specific TF [Penicillium roqueforti]KAI3157786.1 transcriptional regulator family: Fungal Specific TF [Penicillium roqueforti]